MRRQPPYPSPNPPVALLSLHTEPAEPQHACRVGTTEFPAAPGTSRTFWFLARRGKLQPQPAIDKHAHP